jgi:formate-dependent nitrite reductase membrane component NrfD
MNELELSRHSPILDPTFHIWGWEVPVYLFLGGLAAGAMILVPLLSARPGSPSRTLSRLAFAAPVLVSVGMLALLLDLEHKLHAWRFYLAFRWTSPMSWGAWILVLVYPVSILLALAGLDDADAEALAGRAGPLGGPLLRMTRRGGALARPRLAGLRLASIACGIALGIYTGILLSALAARPLWASAVLGPLFLASGLSAGAAFLLLFRLPDEERRWLVRADLMAMGVEAALLLLFVLGHATGGTESQVALALLTSGPYAAAFWGLVVGGGLALPALLEALEHKVHAAAALAPGLVLMGGLALRWILVSAGQR